MTPSPLHWPEQRHLFRRRPRGMLGLGLAALAVVGSLAATAASLWPA